MVNWLELRTAKERINEHAFINNKKIHLGYYKTAEEAYNFLMKSHKHIEEYVDNESFMIIKNKLYT